MPSDADILQTIQQAFGSSPRPEHFTNYIHCPECAEHDEVLRSRNVQTLSRADVGNPGCDPICFVSHEGFAYYMPALVRLALAEPEEAHDWYGTQLLFHLCYEGIQSRHLAACTPAQREAVAKFLQHLIETRTKLADRSECADDLFLALEIWSDEIHIVKPDNANA